MSLISLMSQTPYLSAFLSDISDINPQFLTLKWAKTERKHITFDMKVACFHIKKRLLSHRL
jgi:hypothetical protein